MFSSYPPGSRMRLRGCPICLILHSLSRERHTRARS
jgi:hypothetical protein